MTLHVRLRSRLFADLLTMSNDHHQYEYDNTPNGKRKNLQAIPNEKIQYRHMIKRLRFALPNQVVKMKPMKSEYPLTLEFPNTHPSLTSLGYLDPFYKKMFAVDNTMILLHWVPFNGSAITRPSDIPTDIETLAPIFAGVEV